MGFLVNISPSYAASTGGDTGTSLYRSGKKLIIKAKKLEKKEKIEKAKSLY